MPVITYSCNSNRPLIRFNDGIDERFRGKPFEPENTDNFVAALRHHIANPFPLPLEVPSRSTIGHSGNTKDGENIRVGLSSGCNA